MLFQTPKMTDYRLRLTLPSADYPDVSIFIGYQCVCSNILNMLSQFVHIHIIICVTKRKGKHYNIIIIIYKYDYV